MNEDCLQDVMESNGAEITKEGTKSDGQLRGAVNTCTL